jgi:hypothetical protein
LLSIILTVDPFAAGAARRGGASSERRTWAAHGPKIEADGEERRRVMAAVAEEAETKEAMAVLGARRG